MNISQIENDLTLLKNEFPDLNLHFQVYKSNNTNIDYITCIVCHIPYEIFLREWEQIMNVTAVKFQETLSSTLEVWNTYLIFCLDTEPSTEIKYTVENDTFFMRKLVTNKSNWPTDDSIQDFIAKEIFCIDLKLNSLDNNAIDLESTINFDSCLSEQFLLLEKLQKDNIETELSNIINNIDMRDTTNEN